MDNSDFDCSHTGLNTVTLIVSDNHGNSSSCTATVEILDNTQPIISGCPSSIALCGEQVVNWNTPVATDNCLTDFSSNLAPGDIFQLGTTVVTYTATDAGGNTANCSFDVTIHPLPDIAIVQEALPDLCQGLAKLSVHVNNEADLLAPLAFAWSDNLGAERTAVVFENGTFDVTVIDARGCSQTATTTVDVVEDQTLSAYVLLSDKKEIELKRSTVDGGGIGMLHKKGKVKLDDHTVVNTFVKAKEIEVKGGSFVANSIHAKAGVNLPPFLNHNRNGGSDITVLENTTITLSGDLYKKIIVKKNATVYFDNPEVFIKELETKEGATVDFLQDAILRIKKDLKIDKKNSFNPSSKTVLIYLKKKLEVKEDSDLEAVVYTKDKIETKGKSASKPTNMTGLFIALKEIKSDKWTNWNWSSNCNLNLSGNNQPLAEEDSGIIQIKNEKVTQADFEVFPNPASDLLNIDLRHFINENLSLEVYNLHGQLIHTQSFVNFSGSNLQLGTSNWTDGIYLIRVLLNTKVQYNKKVVIQHVK